MSLSNLRFWGGRFLIGLVLLFNVQCALVFIIMPEAYTPGFEMGGAVGTGMVRGFGILFLMWSVPYVAAAANPVKWRFSLYEAIAMQAIGLTGEALILATFPHGHFQIQATLGRFILFDGLGLLALLLAAGLTRNSQQL